MLWSSISTSFYQTWNLQVFRYIFHDIYRQDTYHHLNTHPFQGQTGYKSRESIQISQPVYSCETCWMKCVSCPFNLHRLSTWVNLSSDISNYINSGIGHTDFSCYSIWAQLRKLNSLKALPLSLMYAIFKPSTVSLITTLLFQSPRMSVMMVVMTFWSSRPEVFCQKGVLRNFPKFTRKHLCQSLFFNKVVGLRPATLLKKRLWHRCFPVNFVKFLRTPFFIEHLWWLLLDMLIALLWLARLPSFEISKLPITFGPNAQIRHSDIWPHQKSHFLKSVHAPLNIFTKKILYTNILKSTSSNKHK